MPVRTVHRAPRLLEELTREITSANIHQAVTSSTAAADRANIYDWNRISINSPIDRPTLSLTPIRVDVKFRSAKIRANTGNAVMAIATPMYTRKSPLLTVLPCYSFKEIS